MTNGTPGVEQGDFLEGKVTGESIHSLQLKACGY